MFRLFSTLRQEAGAQDEEKLVSSLAPFYNVKVLVLLRKVTAALGDIYLELMTGDVDVVGELTSDLNK